MRRTVSIVFTVLILLELAASVSIASPVLASATQPHADPMFDNSGGGNWEKYIRIVLDATAWEDAQYRIVIDGATVEVYNAFGELEGSGNVTDFWSLVQSDGDDIRIYNQKGEQLYFWIEVWDYANQYAEIWVRLTAGSNELNIAYGNPKASRSSYEDPTKVFEFFDGFDVENAIATNGGPWATYDAYIHPPAVYHNGKVVIAYQGPNQDIYVVAYDAVNKTVEGPYFVADNPLTNDNHGAPAIWVDPEGYYHIVYGAHATALKHVKSAEPYNISLWVQMSDITASATYPQVIWFNNTLYLFYRAGGHTADWVYRTSTDGGNTWSNETVLIDSDSVNVWYVTFRKGRDGRIHVAWVWKDESNLLGTNEPEYWQRYNLYYMYLDFDGVWKNITGHPVQLPITKSVADECCLVLKTEDIPMHVNEPIPAASPNGTVYILFVYGGLFGTTDTFKWRIAKWNGTAWEIHDIANAPSIFVTGDLIVVDDNTVEAYIPVKAVACKQNPDLVHGGQVEKWVTYDGGKTWVREKVIARSPSYSLVMTSSSGFAFSKSNLFNGVHVVENYTEDFKIVFHAFTPNLWDEGDRAVLLWGENGFVGDKRQDGYVRGKIDVTQLRAAFYTTEYQIDSDIVIVARGELNSEIIIGPISHMQPNHEAYSALLSGATYNKIQIARVNFETNEFLENIVEISFDPSLNQKYLLTFAVRSNGYAVFRVDGASVSGTSSVVYSDGYPGFAFHTGANSGTGSAKFWWFAVLKYADPVDVYSVEEKTFYVVKKVVQLDNVIYVEYVDVNGTLVTLAPTANLTISNKEKLDVRATVDILNASQTNVTVKLHSKIELVSISLNETVLTPSLIGNETIGSTVFNVYEVTIPGNGTLSIVGALPNVLWGVNVPEMVVVGDSLRVAFPRKANVTIVVPKVEEYTWTGTLWGGENFTVANGTVTVERVPYAYEDFSDISDWTIETTAGGTPTVDSAEGISPPSLKFPDTSSTDPIKISRFLLPTHGEYVFEIWQKASPTSTGGEGGSSVYLHTAGQTSSTRIAHVFSDNQMLAYHIYPGGTLTPYDYGQYEKGKWYRVVIVVSQSLNKANVFVFDVQGNLVASATNIDISGVGPGSSEGDVVLYSSVKYVGNTWFDELKVYEKKVVVNAAPGFEMYLYDENGSMIASARDVDNDGVESIMLTELYPLNVTLKVRYATVAEEKQFIDVDSIEYRMLNPTKHCFEALVEDYQNLEFGYIYVEIAVDYGSFVARVKDLLGQIPEYEPLTIVVENASTGEEVARIAAYEHVLSDLPAGLYRIKVLFRGVVIAEELFNLTTETSGSAIEMLLNMIKLAKDYRGLERSLVAPKGISIVGFASLSDRFPYSRMRILLNGTGSFKLFINYRGDLPTKVGVAGNVTNLRYYWDGSYLVIEGSLGSVGEINVTDLYRLRIEIYDRLGNRLPLEPEVIINGSGYIGPVVEDYLYPADYVVELPTAVGGFEFYAFFDGYNQSVRIVTINHTDVILKAWYRVPTSLAEVKGVQVKSMRWLPFLEQGSDRVKVYIEGYLLDYYGYGVPNRPITINVTDVELGFTRAINVTTDATGYFRTPLLELVRGRTYRIDIVYSGDDIYVGSCSTMEIKPEELPTAPAPFEIPMEYIVIGAATVIVIIGIAAAITRAVKHVVHDVVTKRRKFVRKK